MTPAQLASSLPQQARLGWAAEGGLAARLACEAAAQARKKAPAHAAAAAAQPSEASSSCCQPPSQLLTVEDPVSNAPLQVY